MNHGFARSTSTRRRSAASIAVALACAPIVAPSPAEASTAAGTRIVNVAGLSFEQGGRAASIASNSVTLTIDEVVDLALVAQAASIAVARADAVTAVAFTLTNLGNAAGSFAIATAADRPATSIVGIVSDTDGNGLYDPAIDRSPAGPALTLDAGQACRFFVLARSAADGDAADVVTATATAAIGHGPPGTMWAGAGAAGSDAVVGRTGATAIASTRLLHDGDAPTLEKSQEVVASDGSARAVPGSVITYRIDARFPGATPGADVVDAIPAGTRFVPGSIVLDGIPVTDAAGDDAAAFDGAAVRVVLGDVAAGVRTIRFKVAIQ